MTSGSIANLGTPGTNPTAIPPVTRKIGYATRSPPCQRDERRDCHQHEENELGRVHLTCNGTAKRIVRRALASGLRFESPGAHAVGLDPNHGGRPCDGLGDTPDLDSARPPGCQDFVDHDRGTAVARDIAVLLGVLEVSTADVDGVGHRVVAPADRDDVGRAITPHRRNPRQPAPTLQKSELVLLKRAHAAAFTRWLASDASTPTLTAHTTTCIPTMVRRIAPGGPGIVAGIESDAAARALATMR